MRLRCIFLSILTMLFVVPATAQTTAPGSDIASRTRLSAGGTRAVEQRVYDNGLGDVVQEVLSYPGSSLPSIVIRHEYDEYRRRTKTWLPVTSSGSGYVSGSAVASLAQSQYGDTAPFSRTVYDDFLPSQPSAQYKAGAQWQSGGKKVSVTYSEYVGSGMYSPEDGYLYITNNTAKFLCTRTVDEDSCWSAQYTDLNGRVMISETSQGKTYYMYNQHGDITHVIPPALAAYLFSHYEPYYDDIPDTDVMMQKYAYIYRYDSQRHCIYKKLPGCEPVYYVYDRTGACILTQDGEQRQRGEWAYTIPDRFGRACISGTCHNSIDYTAEPLHPVFVYAEYDGNASATGGYTVHNLTLNQQALYSAAYYDNYSFIGHHGVPSSLTASSISGFTVDTSIGRGMQTGTATAVLSNGSVSGYTYSAIYYDSRYNVSQVRATSHLGGIETACTSYSYTGKPLNAWIQYSRSGYATTEIGYAYTYDNADRMASCTLSIAQGGTPVASTQTYEYDALGRLSGISRTANSNTSQNVSYEYDLHGWLTGITTGSFQEELYYAGGLGTPCYNGNISSIMWKDKTASFKRGYKFTYDDASRLTQAVYGEGNALTSHADRYSEGIQYDAVGGNVTGITRRGKTSANAYGLMDNLTLAYDGYQLTGVSETAADNPTTGSFEYKRANGSQYIYDSNGALIADKSRGIAYITYNANGSPKTVYFTNGNETRYTYSASGQKLRVEYNTAKPNITRPFGTTPSDLTLDMILHRDNVDYLLGGSLVVKSGTVDKYFFDGGYAKKSSTGSSFVFYYYNKDHLGNNREVVSASRNAVVQVTNYYPSGTPYADENAERGADIQPYKYNGKELDLMHGLNTYDYGARQYDPILARWDRVDPLCEKYYSVSPYVYCGNNPMKFIDPDGKEIWIYYYDTYGHEQSFQYSVGMSCTVNNSVAQAFVNNLNTMSTNDAGKTVINAIVNSKTKYGFAQAATRDEGGEGYFDPITKTTSIDDVNNTLTFAEEAFHMYQRINNQGGKTDVNEVEAKLFSAKMNCEISEWDNGDWLKKISGKANSPYSHYMSNLLFRGYDDKNYRGAVNCFFSGSYSGEKYKDDLNYKHGNISSHPLIKHFLPIKDN